jgi:hypothetical protein
MRQKKLFYIVRGLIVFIILCLAGSAVSAGEPLAAGSTLPEFSLRMPDSPDIGAYLGVKGVKTFPWSQVKAKLLVVEFFEVFCPVCQGNAPMVNRLFKVIQEDKDLSKNIKMLGLSIGSEPSDLAAYKQKFKPEFPVFSDYQKEIQTKSKVKFVPLLIVVDKNGKILMSHSGAIKDLDAFLSELRKHYKSAS